MSSRSGRASRTSTASHLLTATMTAAAAAVTALGVPTAAAQDGTPDVVPSECEDFGSTGAYRCQVHSDAMDRDVPVIVRPALTEDNPKVAQFIDGANSTSVNTWVTGAKALDHVAEEDYTFVFPSMDGFTWSLDWEGQDEVKYETFLSEELPDFLEDGFEVPDGGRGTTGVTGLSSGAYGAVNLASKHPDLYSSVYAMSGLYDPGSSVQRYVFDSSTADRSDYDRGPWDGENGDELVDEDNPTLNIKNLTMPVLVTASTGIPNFGGDLGPDPIATIFNGGPYEAGSFIFTKQFQANAVAAGMDNIEFRYDTVGAHTWDTWQRSAFEQGNVDTFLSRIGGDGEGDLPSGPVGSAIEGSGSSGSSGSATGSGGSSGSSGS
ncbi:MAG TPA: trehalose corynomycolyl transferase [Candidatus Corynebacterium avicola]|uniref:Trehalose corynomycolyl transferase n=1 Tax=Candidatus Corynebacterium avicola TaxID=2838527 RepID=A0A9D1ULN6_9CORY|nr:trehalose corynomycolyl transferase [Candidatus Corynebacterium avicola]